MSISSIAFTFSYSAYAIQSHIERHPYTLTKSTKFTMAALVTVNGGSIVK